jgi:hypothetical protein
MISWQKGCPLVLPLTFVHNAQGDISYSYWTNTNVPANTDVQPVVSNVPVPALECRGL